MSSKAWQVTTFAVALIAVGVGAYAFTQHSEVTDLTAQFAAATADAKQAHDAVLSLTSQLATVKKDAEQAHSEADATEARATAERQQLQTTQAKLAAETRPDLPVNLSFRKGLQSQGLVGVFRNTSARELEFTIDVESPATGRQFRITRVLNPNGMSEIGAQQGWVFAPGQRITLNNSAYRPRQFTVGG